MKEKRKSSKAIESHGEGKGRMLRNNLYFERNGEKVWWTGQLEGKVRQEQELVS